MPSLVRRRVSVLDLGFEDAKKLKELAKKKQHAKKKFLGVEWVKQQKLATRTHNLKLTYGDALSKLRRLPPASVNVITADFFFSEFKIEGNELGGKDASRYMQEKFKKRRNEILKQVTRVLAPKGRFFVIEYGLYLDRTMAMLSEAGFSCTKKTVLKSQMNRTLFLSDAADKMITNGRYANEIQPYIITARKKPLA
jgi:ubiquinone/menaquinone biosynthesis C-methylase UbiE